MVLCDIGTFSYKYITYIEQMTPIPHPPLLTPLNYEYFKLCIFMSSNIFIYCVVFGKT